MYFFARLFLILPIYNFHLEPLADENILQGRKKAWQVGSDGVNKQWHLNKLKRFCSPPSERQENNRSGGAKGAKATPKTVNKNVDVIQRKFSSIPNSLPCFKIPSAKLVEAAEENITSIVSQARVTPPHEQRLARSEYKNLF
jgi:hypothetical protein